MTGTTFQRNPTNGSRDTDEETCGSPCKVPWIIDGSQPNRKCYSLEMRLCGLQK